MNKYIFHFFQWYSSSSVGSVSQWLDWLHLQYNIDTNVVTYFSRYQPTNVVQTMYSSVHQNSVVATFQRQNSNDRHTSVPKNLNLIFFPIPSKSFYRKLQTLSTENFKLSLYRTLQTNSTEILEKFYTNLRTSSNIFYRKLQTHSAKNSEHPSELGTYIRRDKSTRGDIIYA